MNQVATQERILSPDWLKVVIEEIQQETTPQTAVSPQPKPSRKTAKIAACIRETEVDGYIYKEYDNLYRTCHKDGELVDVKVKALVGGQVVLQTVQAPDWLYIQNPAGHAYYEDGLHCWVQPNGRVIRSHADGRLYKYTPPKPAHGPVRETAPQTVVTKPATLPGGTEADSEIAANLEVFSYTSTVLGKMLKPSMFKVLSSHGRAYLVQYEPRQEREPKLPFLIIPGLLENARAIGGTPALRYVRSRYELIHGFLVDHATWFANGDTYNIVGFRSAQTAVQKILDVYSSLAADGGIKKGEMEFLALHLRAALAYPERYAEVAPAALAADRWAVS